MAIRGLSEAENNQSHIDNKYPQPHTQSVVDYFEMLDNRKIDN